ncbi:hypothetical protein [Mycobacteroides salmoniphilum]|uniref:hypothetical protein n=1 Tax=Mycobacteroides salmoniphilum TaxID=404941 RepID=UPI00099436A4|nr:hypothetical protein [Mycobacteroides salmoniphilum]
MGGERVKVNLARWDQVIGELAGFDKEIEQQIATLEGREDAESLNNTLDRTLYGGRITAHSATRQHGVMIGFALGRNAIAHYLHQRRQKTTTS